MMNAVANMAAVRTSAATAVATCRMREFSYGLVSVGLFIAVYSSAANGVVKRSHEAGFDVLFVCHTIVWSQERRRTCTSLWSN